jgi:hypothetical protein
MARLIAMGGRQFDLVTVVSPKWLRESTPEMHCQPDTYDRAHASRQVLLQHYSDDACGYKEPG